MFLLILTVASLVASATSNEIFAAPVFTVLPDPTSGIKICQSQDVLTCNKIVVHFDVIKSMYDPISIPGVVDVMSSTRIVEDSSYSHVYTYKVGKACTFSNFLI